MINTPDTIEKVARQCQIIVGALIAGVLILLGVASLVDLRPNAAAPVVIGVVPNAAPGAAADRGEIGPIITYTAVALTALALPLSFLVPGLVTRQNRRAIAAGTWTPPAQGGAPGRQIPPETLATDSGKLAMLYQIQLIIGAALDEGAAFCAGIAYLIGRNPIALAMAFLLVGGLVVRFPTPQRVALWIDQQQEKLVEERQTAA
jgi:hypothetical protein